MSISSQSSWSGDPDDQVPLSDEVEQGAKRAEQPEEPVEPAGGAEEVPGETPSLEVQLPPEAQGEVNGGPLGCCLGVLVGLVLSVSVPLISRAFGDSLIHALGGSTLRLLVQVLMGIVLFVAVIICGRLGWKIGQRIYREYPTPVVRRRQRRR